MPDQDELVTIFRTRGLSALTTAYASVAGSLSIQIERMDAAAESAARLYQAQQQLKGFRLPTSSAGRSPAESSVAGETAARTRAATIATGRTRTLDPEVEARRKEAAVQRMGRIQSQAYAENDRRTAQVAAADKKAASQKIADAERLRRSQEARTRQGINTSGKIDFLTTGYAQAASQALASAGLLDSRLQRPIQAYAMLQSRVRALPPEMRAVAMEEAGIASVAIGMGIAGVAAFEAIKKAAEQAIDSLIDYANQVRTLQSLTGTSASQSSAEVTLFRGAGVKDVQAIRDVLKLTKDFQSVQGRAGLGRLGIAITPDQNGITTLNQVISSLQSMPDGLRKATVEEEIFGARGVMALQPLLRMSGETRDKLIQLGEGFDTNVLPAVQALQEQGALLGETWMQGVILPFATSLLPIFTQITGLVLMAVDAFNWLNKAMRGALIPAVVFGTLAGSIGLIVAGVIMLIGVTKALIPLLMTEAKIEAFKAALEGPKGIAKLALALGAVAAVSSGVVFGADAALRGAPGPGDKMNSAADKFASSVDRFNSSVEDFKRFSKGGAPDELSASDITNLGRMGRLGAFG